jgi:two-component system, CitB family, sensor kinase
MSFVVITDDAGIRQSHPDPERIGERVSTDPDLPLAGERVIEVDTGTLGTSVRGKAPVTSGDEIVGMVSVGVLQDEVLADFLVDRMPTALLFLVPALALGVGGSLLLTRRVKRLTFGLEPREIATLLEQRQAMLHGIREGIVGLDQDGRVAVVNDEARRLFGFDGQVEGSLPVDVVSAGPLLELLDGKDRADDVVVVADAHVLVASRMPVEARGEPIGTVVTVGARTELATMSRELASLRDVADALRAQAHEFDNRMHTLAGLIEMGNHQDALSMITEASLDHQRFSESLVARVQDPTLVALLLMKTAVAEERNVALTLSDDSWLDREFEEPTPLLTIVGNLIDNAIDATTEVPGRQGRVVVRLRATDDRVAIRVADDGPGIDVDEVDRLFQRGYSTKVGSGERGLGLALVRQVVTRLGGDLEVWVDDGAVFDVTVPVATLSAASSGPNRATAQMTFEGSSS